MNDYPRVNYDRIALTFRYGKVLVRDNGYCVWLAPNHQRGVKMYWTTHTYDRLQPYVLAYLAAH